MSVLAPLLAIATGASAQNSQMQELLNRMERMQSELTTLQRQIYQGGGSVRTGGAPPSGSQARKLTARMSVRISQLEDELRRLTGKTEEFLHAIQQMRARTEKLATDVEFRLNALERGGVATGAPPPAPDNAPPPAAAAGSQPGFASGPRTLGTIRKNALPVPGAVAATPPKPKMTPKQQYDHAHSLIVKDQNFAEAEKVLRAFIETHPKHALAPNAYYWLGRTYYVRKAYQKAVFTFAEGFQKFSKSAKAPDNLLNLGMSLARLGKKKEACTAFKRLLKNYPKVVGNV
ncbi:MAG: tol-pal system protein YbgF, partial [Alphaproteobacteria bacterium]